ncbi:MAG: hypothetical protein WBG32_15535 [Nodosilinea sp.]
MLARRHAEHIYRVAGALLIAGGAGEQGGIGIGSVAIAGLVPHRLRILGQTLKRAIADYD